MAEITAQLAQELLGNATPGPWRVGPEGSEGSYVLPDCGDKRERTKYITLVGGRVQPLDGKNALLIAAAPDLAESVITLTERLERIRGLYNRRTLDAERRLPEGESLFLSDLRAVLYGVGSPPTVFNTTDFTVDEEEFDD